MPDITLHGVRKSFAGPPRLEVLNGVDLHVPAGTFIAIEGESGSGKSTLLNILGLLDEIDDGAYSLGEQRVDGMSASELAQTRSRYLGFIFQNFHLLDRRPAWESVELGLLYTATPRSQRRQRALDALHSVGLEQRAFTRANLLSGGERQRVAIARAMASDAPIIIADEPTGNLDSENTAAVLAILRRLADGGRTVVMVTHSPAAASVADRRFTMRDGQLLPGAGATSALRPSTTGDAADVQANRRPATLRVRDLIGDALRGLASTTGRTLGLAVAVAVAVGLVVTSLGLSDTSRAQVADTFNAAANRRVSATWDSAVLPARYSPTAADAVEAASNLAGVRMAALAVTLPVDQVRASPDRPAYNAPSYAVYGDVGAGFGLTGSHLPSHEWQSSASRSNGVLIGADLAARMQLGPDAGANRIQIGNAIVPVQGIIEASTRMPELSGAIVHAGGSRDVASGQRQLFVTTSAGAALQVARQLPLAIAPTNVTAVQVRAPQDPSTIRGKVEDSVRVTLLALTGVAGLAALAALTNALVLSVLERRRELGLRRAVGARARHLAALIVVESGAIGVIGGVIGLLGGLAAVLIITLANRWSPVFNFALMPTAVGGGILVGMLGGVAASLRAARIAPSEALRQ